MLPLSQPMNPLLVCIPIADYVHIISDKAVPFIGNRDTTILEQNSLGRIILYS